MKTGIKRLQHEYIMQPGLGTPTGLNAVQEKDTRCLQARLLTWHFQTGAALFFNQIYNNALDIPGTCNRQFERTVRDTWYTIATDLTVNLMGCSLSHNRVYLLDCRRVPRRLALPGSLPVIQRLEVRSDLLTLSYCCTVGRLLIVVLRLSDGDCPEVVWRFPLLERCQSSQCSRFLLADRLPLTSSWSVQKHLSSVKACLALPTEIRSELTPALAISEV